MPKSNSSDPIAQRLALARDQAGLTQAQVAQLLGLHRPTISEIEAGRRKVSATELQKFATAYGVSLTWLMGTEQENDPHKARVELAARELAKLKNDDLERVLGLLSALRNSED